MNQKKDKSLDSYLENLDEVFAGVKLVTDSDSKPGVNKEMGSMKLKAAASNEQQIVNEEESVENIKEMEKSRNGWFSKIGDRLRVFLQELRIRPNQRKRQKIQVDKDKVSNNNMPMRRRINKWQKIFINRLKLKRGESASGLRSRRAGSRLTIKLFGREIVLNKTSIIKYGAISFFLAMVIMTLMGVVVFAWYSKDLPRPDKIMRKEGFATKIYDRNDVLLYEVFVDEKRIPIEFSQIPESLKNATVATEDKNFYKRKKGLEIESYLRIIYNVLFKGKVIGGSTLTNQIVKNVILTNERTVSRKIKELVLSIQIERKYSKDEILNIYLNEAPYGGTAWGVVTAAEMYFGKQVKDLNLLESAILAGMPQSPSGYSPYGVNPDAFKYRAMDVLRRMREDGYITKEQEEEAKMNLDNVTFKELGGDIKAPHFVMYVKKIMEERYGENLVEQGGLTIKTTLDYELHEKIQDIVSTQIAEVEKDQITNGAVVISDPKTGEILSMVGSKDYFAENYDGKVNVTTSLRQPGSSIKPVTYAQALIEGYTPESVIMDVKTDFPGVDAAHPYVPKNYNGKFNGPVSLRNALGSSLNIPAVKLLALVGVEDMMQLGYDMGISTFEPSQEETNRLGLSVTLGGGEVTLLELTTAYSAFANGGMRVEPVSILEVKDRDGKTLEKYKEIKGKQVMDKAVAYLISHMLSDNNARLISFGSNSLLNINWRTIAVKTGTTDDQRDNWAVGWSPQVIVGVWVGNNDNSKMSAVASGVSGASPIWRESILAALDGKPVEEFKMPDSVESIKVDKVTGYSSHDGFEEKDALVIKGTLPAGEDPYHKKLKVCKSDENKLAPVTVVAKGDYNEKEFFVFRESDPLFGDNDNHWQKGIDEWAGGQSDGKYKPPTEYCSTDDAVVIRIEEPGDHSNNVPNKFKVKVRVGASDEVEKIKFYANGNEVGEIKDKPYEKEIELSDGVYELKAQVYLKNGKSSDHGIRIGVNKNWDWVAPTPTPSPSPVPTASPTPTPVPSASPTPTPTPTPSTVLP